MKKTIVPFSLLFALATGGVNTQLPTSLTRVSRATDLSSWSRFDLFLRTREWERYFGSSLFPL